MEGSDSGRLLVSAGFATWAVAGLPQAMAWSAPNVRSVAWGVAYVTFALAFLVTATGRRTQARRTAMLAAQTVAALVVLALGSTGFEAVLLVIIAGQAPLIIGERPGLAWVLTQTAAMAAVDATSPFHARPTFFGAAAYGGFQLFAFGAARLAAREAHARAELARMHAELLATRELFADGTRAAERLRIARDLHDGLGHHLTALSLQLELARNVADDRTREPVERAHAVAKELLGEVRGVVGTLREDVPLDLSHALRTLVAGVPRPRVHLDVAEDLRVEPALAHTIFRCVQEALTNAVKHAHADNVYLAVASSPDGTVTVTARDDGRGASELRPGNGLSGLRERIEGLGGEVQIEARQGAGLTLRALLPPRAVAT